MKKFLNTTTLLLTPLLALAAAGEVYRIVDPETGAVTYTDQPPPDGKNAETVPLPDVNTTTPVEAPAVVDLNSDEEPGEVISYETVTITSPADGETIPPGQTEVVIRVETDPELQPGHALRVLFNGKPVAPPSERRQVTVGDLIRGTHQINAQIVDQDGRTLRESGTVTIYVKRATRLLGPS